MALHTWFATSLKRIFPRTRPAPERARRLLVPRGGRASLQLCVRNEGAVPLDVSLSADIGEGCEVRLWRVGLVPIAHHNTDTPVECLDGVGDIPGQVPDPLFPEKTQTVPPGETRSFWIRVAATRDARPGPRVLTCRLSDGTGWLRTARRQLLVSPVEAGRLEGFPVTHWTYPDAIADWYGRPPYSERFWNLAAGYLADLADHYNTCQYVPLFTPPTDGVKRPCQLLKVSADARGAYRFDWSDVERWIAMARQYGAQYFEWTHFFTQWGAAYAIRIYRDNTDEGSLLWRPETPATAPVYRRFLARFLPEFRHFLQRHGLLDRSFFHVSDEPGPQHLDSYRAAREMLRELAPWMRCMDAMSHVDFAREGLTDVPVASIHAARDFRRAGIPSFVYFCCGPRGKYLNRLVDTPLSRIRMVGRLLYALDARGFLHWGYNYWYRSQTRDLMDPFTELAGGAWPGWPHGDPFVVYPGPEGPLPSVRWEVWAEGLQDLSLLRRMQVPLDHPLLAGVHDYNDFPSAGDGDIADLLR